jgi:hypothetical protein
VISANGPFLLPDPNRDANEVGPRDKGAREIEEAFKNLPLELFAFKDEIFESHFKDEKILLAVEGSRHFSPPSGLGEAPFEGCAVAVFAADVTAQANSFMRDASAVALRTEQIEGQKVTVFQERREQDTWTTFVAFPKPNVAVAASNEEYLREVLARIEGKVGDGALPETLPEWKHLNPQAEFWGARHYDRKGKENDPTSPFGTAKAGSLFDDRAIGVTFDFDPAKSETATVTYLSGDERIMQNVQKNLFPIESELGAREMNIRYRQLDSGIVEGSYDLVHIESAELFAFVLEYLLGHAIFV